MSFAPTFERRDDAACAALGIWESDGGAGGRAIVFALWDTVTQIVLGIWPSEDAALATIRALVGDNPDREAVGLARGDALAYRTRTSHAVAPLLPVSLIPLAGD